MTELPGNPHLESICEAVEYGERLTTAESVALEANLAIAFELRTANLIAMQAIGITDLTEWLPEHADAWIERAEEIEKRLGETA